MNQKPVTKILYSKKIKYLSDAKKKKMPIDFIRTIFWEKLQTRFKLKNNNKNDTINVNQIMYQSIF